MKTSLFTSICATIAQSNTPTTVSDLYRKISKAFKRHSIRARLHEATKSGYLRRIGKGIYITSGHQVGQIADARLAVADLVRSKAKFEFVVLDIPWNSPGTNGGNRKLADFATITPAEFGEICRSLVDLVKCENTPLLFFFSIGDLSTKQRLLYKSEIDKYFKAAKYGKYTKTYKNGEPCKFGKYLIPAEGMWLYSISGNVDQDVDLDIEAIRPSTYKTAKPVSLLRRIMEKLITKKAIVFDPFGGSGSTAKAAAEIGASSLSLDIAHNPVTWKKSA